MMAGDLDDNILRQDFDSVLEVDLPWQQFDGATVVVTGASGLLAAYMVEVLLRRNETMNAKTFVVALVRNPENAKRRFQKYADSGLLQIERQDLAEALTYSGSADFIVHAASQASPKYYGSDPVGTALPNTVGTANLLEFARGKKSRGFLFFSSAEVYGATKIEPIHETAFGPLDPAIPRACYAESKRVGETLCVAYAHQYGMRIAIARPFHCYGPGMKFDDGRVFADFVSAAVQGKDIMLRSDGTARRSFCYISDATLGLFTIMLLGQSGSAYNVGNPDATVSIRDLADVVVGLFPEKGLKVRTDASVVQGYIKSDIDSATPDITRLAALGWRARVGLSAGFGRTIKAYSA
jgi:UDP-glucuronate decarboxylase